MSNFNQRPEPRRNYDNIGTVASTNILSTAYMWMALGLMITGIIAYLVAATPAVAMMVLGNPFGPIILMVAQLGVVFYLSSRIMQMNTSTAMFTFILYSVLTGLTLSVIFFIYTQAQIAQAFFIAAAMFGGSSIFGKVTKQDLTSMGHYVGMAVWGLIVAVIVNIFLRSSQLDFFISFIGVILFTALAAYDTQKIMGWQSKVQDNDNATLQKLAILGALHLYLDFINIFLFMLRLLNRRN